jgi:hypothetical protein
MTRNIFVVTASVHHEWSEIIVAFSSQEIAEQFVKKCEDWDRVKPSSEQLTSDKHCIVWNKWKSNHPNGVDYYETGEVELI